MIFIISVGGSIIRNITIKTVDEKDWEFVQGLQNLGVNRKVASVITFLNDQSEKSTREIETATRLRQPEVSVAMRTLRERGWLTEHEIRNDGKGRPLKIYALRSTIDEIMNYYETEKTEEFAQTMKTIKRLKELSSA